MGFTRHKAASPKAYFGASVKLTVCVSGSALSHIGWQKAQTGCAPVVRRGKKWNRKCATVRERASAGAYLQVHAAIGFPLVDVLLLPVLLPVAARLCTSFPKLLQVSCHTL